MKGLVIAPQPFFSPRGTPFSVYHRCLVMSKMGVELDLMTYGQGQDVDLPNVSIHRGPAFRWLGDVPIGPSFLKLFHDVFLFASTGWRLVVRRYDFVHAHEEGVFLAALLKPFFSYKLVYDMHSSLPQQLTNFEFTRSKALIGLFERLESWALRKADAVITISPALADRVRTQKIPGALFLIENSIFEEVQTAPSSPSLETTEEDLPDLPAGRPTVGYVGTLETYQGIDILLDAFALVRESIPEAFLLIVGGTPEQVEKYQAMARRLDLTEACLLTGRLSQNMARRLLAEVDVVVSPRSRGTNTPLKIYEILASGIPLVATRIESHTQVLSRAICFLADPEPAALARAIVSALDDPDKSLEIAQAARAFYEENYSRAVYDSKIKALLEAIG
ncbi:MAG: glycosyltransferase family 4 protein [Thermoanaerobaculia bacterium]|jgi:glycosyltransferase involved in cell wall biosynthesis